MLERLIAINSASVEATSALASGTFRSGSFGHENPPQSARPHVPYQGSGPVTTPAPGRAQSRPGQTFLRAYVEAIHAVRTNPTLSKRAFAKYRQTKDEKQIEDAYQTLREMVPQKPGYPSIDGFADHHSGTPLYGSPPPRTPIRDFMDTSLLEELDRSDTSDAPAR